MAKELISWAFSDCVAPISNTSVLLSPDMPPGEVFALPQESHSVSNEKPEQNYDREKHMKLAAEITELIGVNKRPQPKTGNSLLDEKGWVITPEKAEKLIFHDEFWKFRNDVAVLDLRDHDDWVKDDYGMKILSAVDYPISQSKLIRLNSFAPPDLFKLEPKQEKIVEAKKYWDKELEREDCPLHRLEERSVIIVHCAFSSFRTPRFAAGLVQFFAEPRGQTVYILDGGFEGFKAKIRDLTRFDYRDRKDYQ